MMGDIVLLGCRAEPLASYLKGLGVLRLVAEQLDPLVAGRWEGDRLVVSTTHDQDDVVGFFVDHYRPTPVVSPWNKGSGFHPKDNTTGITAIEGSTNGRLTQFRETVGVARRLVADPRWPELDKAEQVRWCRNEVPDDAVPWLDAAVVLSEAGAVYPPLLGTGGNVGRLDFSNNFMQRLVDVLAFGEGRSAATREDAHEWLVSALTGAPPARLLRKPVGQFDPGGAGGAGAPEGGPEESLLNPWDFVLMFEGALLFASGAARRMGADGGGKAAMPFTFDTTPSGYPSASEGENAKGELWAPLWSRPASVAEVVRLLGEGRAEWGGGQARRGVDVARAAASLGVDRGIDQFVRYAFVERMGQSMLALPVGRVSTAKGSRPDVSVLGQLDPWVEQVRRARNVPAVPAAAIRRLDASMLDLVGARDPVTLQEVLACAADLERAVARSGNLRQQVSQPLGNRARSRNGRSFSTFDARDWVPLLDDGTSELRLALALASCRDQRSVDRSDPDVTEVNGEGGSRATSPPLGPTRPGSLPATLLRSIERTRSGRWEWRVDGRPVVAGLGTADVSSVLAAFVGRRSIEMPGRRTEDDPGGQVGVDPGYSIGIGAPVDDVARFVEGRIDDERLSRLLAASMLLHFDRDAPALLQSPDVGSGPRLPTAAALVLPFFHGSRVAVGREQVRLRPAASWSRLLRAGRVAEVVDDALHRLRVARMAPLVGSSLAIAQQIDGTRLLAATAFRLTPTGASALLRRVARPSGDDASTAESDNSEPEGDA